MTGCWSWALILAMWRLTDPNFLVTTSSRRSVSRQFGLPRSQVVGLLHPGQLQSQCTVAHASRESWLYCTAHRKSHQAWDCQVYAATYYAGLGRSRLLVSDQTPGRKLGERPFVRGFADLSPAAQWTR